MKINAAEQLHEAIEERIWKEKEQREGMKTLARRSIFRIIERAKGSHLTYEIKKQMDGFSELETLNAILSEIWSVKDIGKIWAVINKYDWLEEMKRLDGE